MPQNAKITVFDLPRRQFYEGKWVASDLSDGSLRNWLVRKQRFFVRRLARAAGGPVLDLGCGGGWKLFTRAGPVIGVDISAGSLLSATSLYQGGVQGDLSALPFHDASFAMVLSSDVLGHVPLERKQRVIEEIYRVLRPGGRTLHYIEAEGDDPLTRFAQRDPASYQRYIIGPEGHEGIESPARTFQRFREAGFQPVVESSAYRLLMYVDRLLQLYDNVYAHLSLPLRIAITVGRLLALARPLELAADMGVAAVLEVTDRLLPESWGSGVMVEYVKPSL